MDAGLRTVLGRSRLCPTAEGFHELEGVAEKVLVLAPALGHRLAKCEFLDFKRVLSLCCILGSVFFDAGLLGGSRGALPRAGR